MKRRIHFKIRAKSFLVYIILILLIMLAFAGGSLYYVTKQHWQDYSRTMEYECASIAADFAAMYDDAGHLTTFLLSDPDVLAAVQYLSKSERMQDPAVANRYKSDIRAALYSYYITKYYYRVSYINPSGVLVTSDHFTSAALKEDEVRKRWKENYDPDTKSSLQFLGRYQDVWVSGEPMEVVGFIKKIYGDNKGYFEIQISVREFEKLFEKKMTYDTSIIAVLNGNVLYSGLEESEGDKLRLEELEDGGRKISDGKVLTCKTYETEGGQFVLYGALPLWELVRGIGGIYAGVLILVLVLIFLTFMFLFFYLKNRY